jgi:hypothetical protein
MLVRLVYLLMIKLFCWLALLARSAPPRTLRSWCSGMRSPSCAARLPAPGRTGDRAVIAALARLLPRARGSTGS